MRTSDLVILAAFVGGGILATSSVNAEEAVTPSWVVAEEAAILTSANANSAIVADITLTKDADMNFGDVIAGGTTGTVVLPASASPSRSVTGGTTLGNSTSVTSATFTVGGDASATYSITLPSSDITITSGANSMIVNTFTSSPSSTGALDGSGLQTLYVGATLNVGASQATGSDYTGSFDVTVAYN